MPLLAGLMLLVLWWLPALAGASETADEDIDPVLKQALYDHPPASGRLIIRLQQGGRAEAMGLRNGDILMTYNGEALTSLALANAAEERAANDPQAEVTLWRGSASLTLMVPGGHMGVLSVQVRKGVPFVEQKTNQLPEPTPALAFDLDPLRQHPRSSSWYTLYLDKRYAGALHIDIKARRKYVQWTTEMAMTQDGGGFSRSHQLVREITEFNDHLTFHDSEQADLLHDADGKMERHLADAGRTCELRVQGAKAPFTLAMDPQDNPVCVLTIPALIQLLPRKNENCLHLSLFDDYRGELDEIAFLYPTQPPLGPAHPLCEVDCLFPYRDQMTLDLDEQGHLVKGIWWKKEHGELTFSESSEEDAASGLGPSLAFVTASSAAAPLPDDQLLSR